MGILLVGKSAGTDMQCAYYGVCTLSRAAYDATALLMLSVASWRQREGRVQLTKGLGISDQFKPYYVSRCSDVPSRLRRMPCGTP